MKIRPIDLKTSAAMIVLAFALGVGMSAAPAAASGVGDSSGTGGYQHSSSGVGPNIGVSDPGVPPLMIQGITLGTDPVEHNPTVNQPSINYSSQPDPHNPSPVVPGINYDPQSVTHNPSPVVPGINYDPIGVVHNPSPVLPAINYAPHNVTHYPSPVVPGIELGQTSVTHRPNIAVPNFDFGVTADAKHNVGIHIPINLPNLNIDINGMISNVNSGGGGGCRPRCGGGERNVGITINRSHTENNLYYRGGSTYYYVEDRTPVYVEFAYEEETYAHQGWVPIRAVCLDNASGVHPASQVFPEETVDEALEGEIYRCVIGTSMQVTMGEMVDGQRDWEGAWTETCQAGEALRYADGEVFCAPQEERRPCNERSLLRRFGPGEKVVRLNGMSMTTQSARSTLGMDGGVGSYRRY